MMKKYTINEAKEFCQTALEMPPIEQFESGEIDEALWFDEHRIRIAVGDHEIELDYNADNVNELDGAIMEMYEVEADLRYATTGNTVGSKYRPAELKDILRVGIYEGWDKHGYEMGSFKAYIQHFVSEIKDKSDVMGYYDVILEDIPHYTECFKCDFSKLNMQSMRCINTDTIKKAIGELICTDRELLYGVDAEERSSDITFMMDYTFKMSGELIGWWYGEADEAYIKQVIEDYKKSLFE